MFRVSSASRTFLAVVLGLALGAVIGIGGYTFAYAKGAAYLQDDPAACANCHIMTEQYDGWRKSSHHAVATCNDCHTPAAFVPKYLTKASNGFWHSFYFTTGTFPDPIRIRPSNRVVELDDTITDPAMWGRNFPLQYDSYQRTVDQRRRPHGVPTPRRP
ncbi:Cytochrome c nitrite reductase, small subunit NrfH [Myxococcus hansupus]|uniref:Cytochrome c nitrite reductase, small subunit NrfH n=1 Tax=Pseudomyxococcus hansupus TaxID=1297742 RepID=A0A0H4WT49_9BACT|nr:cytochrome c nitrite reductase small subunit [Myxococcus hansupus]AKQ64733.1 Cytochrome c nitrite reductase, small subunit NrfH [Myxococcus hansupus]